MADSLAAETLAHIFVLGATPCAERPDTFQDATALPVLVSHVSRRWRAIALTTPRLWSTILLCSSACLPLLRLFLARSRACPLTVHLDVRSPSWAFDPSESTHPFTPAHMSALMDLLLPHLGRWEDVEVLSDTWAPLYVFLARCTRSVPRVPPSNLKAGSLRRLALSRCNAYFALEGTRFAPAAMNAYFAPFADAPALRDVTLAGVHVAWGDHPFRNLTHFSLKYHAQDVLPTPSEFVAILASSPDLETLSILGWGVRSFEDEPSLSDLEGSIVVRHLRALTLGWADVQHTLRLLSLFSWGCIKKLRQLVLEDVTNSLDPISAQDSSAVLGFLTSRLSESPPTSPNSIEELTLHSVRASSSCCHRFLRQLPDVKTLTLDGVAGAVLGSLCRAREEPMLCPELSRVIVRDADSVCASMLEQLVDARKARHAVGGLGAGSAEPRRVSIIVEVEEDTYDSDLEGEDGVDVGPRDGFGGDYPFGSGIPVDGGSVSTSDDEATDSEESYYTAPSPSSSLGGDEHEQGVELCRGAHEDDVGVTHLHSALVLGINTAAWSIAGPNPYQELGREGMRKPSAYGELTVPTKRIEPKLL